MAGIVPQTIWLHHEVGNTQEAKKEIIAAVPDAQEVFQTTKPERLLKQIVEIASNAGDWVLDSFAGSGTTGAVAHKMGRRWIMVELGEHCDILVAPRLRNVIDGGDQGGISKAVNWKGGGGFRYYRLGPSLIVEDEWGNPVINPEFNAAMLAEAMCKLEGFQFDPNAEVYWQQGRSTEADFIYVTTQMMTKEMLTKLSDDVGPNRSLLICCGAFRCNVDQFENLTVKKIPKAVLKKCEWGHDDYSLEIKNLPAPPAEPTPLDDEAGQSATSKPRKPARKFGKGKDRGPTLFEMDETTTKGRFVSTMIMAVQHINAISNRLSLRPPQRDSLEILARVCEIIELSKQSDPAAALQAIESEFPTVEDFEREFPSLCFAIATGVGKTRLMGAFISYLHQAEGIYNFFVLAPNLTIYNKLIADFTPNTPKYVFKGIGEFTTNPPLVITGDNYESGEGVRGGRLFGDDVVHINIFNISKINSEVRGGKEPRIKRLKEYIGQSYFDYLSGLDDLVMLMDESHRYRATAGVRAINELRPILGLELTATPQVESGGSPIRFKNVIYSYPLASAMTDGFVKEPAVATRENFDPAAYSSEGLEKVKLEDGVRIHENTKVELEVYARNNDKPIVKPFMLVVATDTTHANALQQVIESDTFFEGRYKGKVIQVHSNIRGEEKDDVVQQLLTVEHPDNPVEIVIHVNMLKEGWDVTNLYTIVPLRAANSRTLVEQSIGRGLRLPYGKRVGVPAVDRLTIVSHDKFQEIVDHANDPDSIIRAGIVIGRDIPEAGRKAVEIKSAFEQAISGGFLLPTGLVAAAATGQPVAQQKKLFEKPEEQEVAKATYQVIKQYERLRAASSCRTPRYSKRLCKKFRRLFGPPKGCLKESLSQ